MLVIAAPGQGAQTPGFLAPWLEFPGVADRLGAWSDLVGCDLIKAGTTGTADEIRDTAVAQPLLVAAALAAAGVLGIGPSLTGEEADGARRADGPEQPRPPRRAPLRHRGRPQRRRACRRGDRRSDRVAGRAPAGRRSRPRDGGRCRGRGDLDDRRARRRRGRGPALHRGARAHPGQHQRRWPDRRGGNGRAAWRPSPPTRRPAPGSGRCRWRVPSTPRIWRPPSRRCARRRRR